MGFMSCDNGNSLSCRELEEDDAQDVLNDKMKGSDSSDESA